MIAEKQTAAKSQDPIRPTMGRPYRVLQRKCACAGSQDECEECKQSGMSLQRRARDGGAPASVPPVVHEVLRSPGQSLDPATRAFMEPRFGHDFSKVRVHTDGRAAESARAVNALAYTVGDDLVFGGGQYAPAAISSRRLLAHELTHVVQQRASGAGSGPGAGSHSGLVIADPQDTLEVEAEHAASRVLSPGAASLGRLSGERTNVARGPSALQRQEAGKQAAFAARDIFPYPEKSRVQFNRLLEDATMDTLAKATTGDAKQSLAVEVLRAAEGQVATVTTANDDVYEMSIPSVNLPAKGATPAQTVKNVTLRFRRQADGKFTFELTADEAQGTSQLFAKSDLQISKSDGEVHVSPGGGISAKISPGKTGEVEIVGDLGIMEISALRLTRLPDVPPGSEEQKKISQQITSKAQEARKTRNEEVTLGAGVRFGPKIDPVFTASWRTSFNPVAKAAGIVQVPLHVDIDYAPDRSVLGGVSSGVGLALPTKLPVNIRITAGLAGGSIEGAPPQGGGKRPVLPAFGPTAGAGVGFGGKTFRVEVDYEHLQNLVRSSPNADTVSVSGGVRF